MRTKKKLNIRLENPNCPKVKTAWTITPKHIQTTDGKPKLKPSQSSTDQASNKTREKGKPTQNLKI